MATLAVLAVLVVVVLDLLLTDRLSLFFDAAFIAICLMAALAVRPRDFFAVGVLPPLLMLGTLLILALMVRGAIAEEVDGLIQAVVSGLAHHAGSLIAGYGATLSIIALRQAARRNAGRIRAQTSARRKSASSRSAGPLRP